MPLHPDARALLDEIERLGGQPPEDGTPLEARLAAWQWLEWMGEPEAVVDVEHRFFSGPTADIPVRIYRPRHGEALPAIVYFHGSGFTVNNIAIADAPHRALANRTGCVVVAVNYQKSPEHKFPTPLDDACAAITWVHEEAAGLGLHPEQIGVGGDSAGGTLAAAACLRARDENGPAVAFQLLVYPATDRRFDLPSMQDNAEGYLLTASTMRWFWAQYLDGPAVANWPYACPARATDLTNLPPAIVLTAEFDPLRDDGERYAELLEQAGVPVVRRRYEGMIHGFLWTSARVAGSRQLLDDIGRDVRGLLPEPARPSRVS
jgi:acetyl esterase